MSLVSGAEILSIIHLVLAPITLMIGVSTGGIKYRCFQALTFQTILGSASSAPRKPAPPYILRARGPAIRRD